MKKETIRLIIGLTLILLPLIILLIALFIPDKEIVGILQVIALVILIPCEFFGAKLASD